MLFFNYIYLFTFILKNFYDFLLLIEEKHFKIILNIYVIKPSNNLIFIY